MGKLLGFITPYFGQIILVLAALLLLKQCEVDDLQGKLTDANTTISSAKVSLLTCKGDNETLTGAIEKLNAKVAKLAQEAKDAEGKAKAAGAAAVRKYEQQRADAAKLPGTGPEVMNPWLKSSFPQ